MDESDPFTAAVGRESRHDGDAGVGHAQAGDRARSEEDPAVALYACGFSIKAIADATARGVRSVRGALVGAGVTLRPPGSARQVAGAGVASLPPGPAADIAHRLLAEQGRSRATWRPWDPAEGPEAWETVLLASLDESASVGVMVAAAQRLGRQPTRLEAEAARRAARRLAARGEVDLYRARLRSGGGLQWTITRPTGSGVSDDKPRLVAEPTGPALDQITAAYNITRRLRSLRKATRQLETAALDRDTADVLADAIDTASADLATLRAGLAGRQVVVEKPPGDGASSTDH